MVKDDSESARGWQFWQSQIVYRTTCYRTTWRFRLLVLALILFLSLATRGWWVPAIGWSLVYNSPIERPDLILIDNLDTEYFLFKKAADFQQQGSGAGVLIPVCAWAQDPGKPAPVARETAEIMIRMAGVKSAELLVIQGSEPITLNTARQVGDFLKGTNVKTILILTSGFKSKRLHLIFDRVLSELGIHAYCLPVWGAHRPETWAATWHGIQEVFLQHIKLAYYRAVIL